LKYQCHWYLDKEENVEKDSVQDPL
jgi:hypothetical protein